MTDHGSIAALKTAIDAALPDNNSNAISEGDIRESIKDTADTLDGLNVQTDLAYDAPSRTVTNSNGTNAQLTLADSTNPGLMTAAHFDKVDGISGSGGATPEEFGAVGDGVADDTTPLKTAIQTGWVSLKAGSTYKITSEIQVNFQVGDIRIDGNGATIHNSGTGRILITAPEQTASTTMSVTAARGDTTITVADATGVVVGDRALIQSDSVVESGWNTTAWDVAIVTGVTGNDVTLSHPLNFPYVIPTESVSVVFRKTTKLILNDVNFEYTDLGSDNQINMGGRVPEFNGVSVTNTDHLDGLNGGARNAINVAACVGGRMYNLRGQGCNYLVLANTCRDLQITGVYAANVRHAVSPGSWCDGVHIKNVEGVNNTSTIDSHPAFNVTWENVNALDYEFPNCRATGFRIINVKVRQNNAVYSQTYAYFGDASGAVDAGKYPFFTLSEDHEAYFENFDWQTTAGPGKHNGISFNAGYQRRITLIGCRTPSFYNASSAPTWIQGGEIGHIWTNSDLWCDQLKMEGRPAGGLYAVSCNRGYFSDCDIIDTADTGWLLRAIGDATKVRFVNCRINYHWGIDQAATPHGGGNWYLRFRDCELKIEDDTKLENKSQVWIQDCNGYWGSTTFDEDRRDIGHVFPQWNSSTATNPGTGLVRFNTLTIASITAIYISSDDLDSHKTTAYVNRLSSGSIVTLRNSRNGIFSNNSYLQFQVTGTPVDNTTWLNIPVVHLEGDTLPLNNTRVGITFMS